MGEFRLSCCVTVCFGDFWFNTSLYSVFLNLITKVLEVFEVALVPVFLPLL